MNKISKSQLFNFGVTVLSIVGMFLASKAHDSEMEELKEEPIDNSENVIELWNELYVVNEKILPVKQKYQALLHEQEQLKIRIKKAQHQYFSNKGVN